MTQLPNAKHIDKVLVLLKTHQSGLARGYEASGCLGGAGWRDTFDAAWEAAYEIVCGACRTSLWAATERAGWLAASGVTTSLVASYAYYSTRGAILALSAYDDSAHLLDSTPEEIKLLVALGHPYAILFLSYSGINASA